MKSSHAYLLFVATLLTALGYGATFLLTEHFRAIGGGEIETGKTLGGAMIGTLIGVPLVGWFANRLGAGNMAALGAASVAIGYFSLAAISALTPLISVAGFFIGLGWGTFYLAAPLALSSRVSDQDRGFWFTRFGAFQMGGIGLSPIAGSLLTSKLDLSTGQAFAAVAVTCMVSASLLIGFELMSPHKNPDSSPTRNMGWMRALPILVRTRAIYPILMVGLGACVFSGLLTFQTSLVRGTDLIASTFFAAYAITVVASRFFLAPILGRANGDRTAIVLLFLMTLGVVVAFGFNLGIVAQILSAVLLGIGYGLVYSVIQTQAVNDAPAEYRNAALTWFVIAYFLGIFGFPLFGGWLIVASGKQWFLTVVLAFALVETALAFIRTRVGTPRNPAMT